MNSSELQKVMLGVLARPGSDTRLGRGRHYLAEAVRTACPQDDQPTQGQIQEAIWLLVARGLAYIDIEQPAPENWRLQLTSAGTAVLRDQDPNPDDPEGYLARLYERIPGLSPLVKFYTAEALNSYYHQLPLASTVMLGVAAEAAFLEVAQSFAEWLGGQGGDNLKKVLSRPGTAYLQKFEEFRKRLLPASSQLPPELRDGLELQMNAVLDLLRAYRNDAGHPTGVHVAREECFVNLRVFPRLVQRMYALKAFFDGNG